MKELQREMGYIDGSVLIAHTCLNKAYLGTCSEGKWILGMQSVQAQRLPFWAIYCIYLSIYVLTQYHCVYLSKMLCDYNYISISD